MAHIHVQLIIIANIALAQNLGVVIECWGAIFLSHRIASWLNVIFEVGGTHHSHYSSNPPILTAFDEFLALPSIWTRDRPEDYQCASTWPKKKHVDWINLFCGWEIFCGTGDS